MNEVQILGQIKEFLDALPEVPVNEEAREIALDLFEELGAAIMSEQQAIYGQ